MSAPSKRQDAGHAVAGLFDRASSTGGLAARGPRPLEPQPATTSAHTRPATRRRRPRSAARRHAASGSRRGGDAGAPRRRAHRIASRRSCARCRGPARTGHTRTLGSKFVAAGVLAAAIELLEHASIDMRGVAAGDHDEMKARARDALRRAGATARRRPSVSTDLAAIERRPTRSDSVCC